MRNIKANQHHPGLQRSTLISAPAMPSSNLDIAEALSDRPRRNFSFSCDIIVDWMSRAGSLPSNSNGQKLQDETCNDASRRLPMFMPSWVIIGVYRTSGSLDWKIPRRPARALFIDSRLARLDCSSRVVPGSHVTCPIRLYSSKRMPLTRRAVNNPSHHTSTVGGPDPESHMTTRQGCCVTAIYFFICSCVDGPVLAARAAHCNPRPNCPGFSILPGMNFAANVAPEGFVIVEAWREGGGAVEVANSFTTSYYCAFDNGPCAQNLPNPKVRVSICTYAASMARRSCSSCPIAGGFPSSPFHLNSVSVPSFSE